MKRKHGFGIHLIVCLAFLSGTLSSRVASQEKLDLDQLTPQDLRLLPVQNIIILIPDGCGVAAATLGRWYRQITSGENRISLDEWSCGLIRTYSADNWITDSASSASAMATGIKTGNGFISVLAKTVNIPDMEPVPDAESAAPVGTILEASRLMGKSTGLVITCQFSHATPAAFSSHYYDRTRMDILSEQQVYQGIDVLLGGGRDYLDPRKRPDGEDLFKVLNDRGYRIISGAKELSSVVSGKIWGLFADQAMERHLDRNPDREPSLAEMSGKAIEVLSKNPKGFFLMIEGSQIDWAASHNDPVGTASEMAAFDDAARIALEFARRNGSTAVIVAPDHSTAGLCLGSKCESSPAEISSIFKNARMTTQNAVKLITRSSSRDQIKSIMAEKLAVTHLQVEEIEQIETARADAIQLRMLLGQILSKRCCISWGYSGHNGEDVPLYIFHPQGLRISGVVQNSDIGRYMAGLFGIDLKSVSRRLFVPAKSAFAAKRAELVVDARDAKNPVLVVKKDGQYWRLPVNKDFAFQREKIVFLSGVVVCRSLEKSAEVLDPANWYVPQEAIELIQ